MLSEEENRTLTQVGPGTPMGELLRRYWYPIAAVSEMVEHPTKLVKILGESLVLYRDRQGAFGADRRHLPASQGLADLRDSRTGRAPLRLSWMEI